MMSKSIERAVLEWLETRRLLSGSGKGLYTFTDNAVGAAPASGLVADSKGDLFGIAQFSSNGLGAIFELTPGSNTPTVFLTLNNVTDGGYDAGGQIAIDSAGNIYGAMTGVYQGEGTDGFIYKVTANASFSSMATFNGTNGANPQGGVTVDS